MMGIGLATHAPIIDVSNLDYTYPGADKMALQDVSLRAERGAIFGLLGPSGAGKSTLQRILTRQIRRVPGQIHILGKAIEQWRDDFYEHVGVGFELPNHYAKLTAIENLNFFATLYRTQTKDPMDLLASVGLAHAAHQRVSDFSKGMQVRLNFARALLHSPILLFLDEPTSGLDPTNAAHMRTLIQAQRDAGVSVVLTTHNMHDAEALCDVVGFISDGAMAAIDTPAALKKKYGTREVEVTWREEGTPQRARFALDGLGENPEFLSCIKSKNVETLHSKEATLDVVFQKVTGASLLEEQVS